MTKSDSQKNVFLDGAGDEWLRRNPSSNDNPLDQFDDIIIRTVGNAESIVEVGCADGRRLSRLFEHLGKPSRIAGVDPSHEAITAARNRFSNFNFHVGTADNLPLTDRYNVVILGFCLYLCDRDLLPTIVAEADRLLEDNGTLVIIDFDPTGPRQRNFKHHDGVWSYKMDYSQLFLSFPQYVLANKASMSHRSAQFEVEENERVAVWILKKNLSGGYSTESDT